VPVITVAGLAASLQLEPPAEQADAVLSGIATLERAGQGDLAFMGDATLLPDLRATRAACVLLEPQWAAQSPVPVLCCDDPYLTFARASWLFRPGAVPAPGVHPQAAVAAGAVLGSEVEVAAGACIGAEASLGEGVVVEAGAVVGAGCQVGAGCRIHAGAVLYGGARIGAHCVIHGSAVIGADGDFALAPGGWERIQPLAAVVLGDLVHIGAGCTVERGTIEDTVIADGAVLGAGVHVGQGSGIGARTRIGAGSTIGARAVVGDDCGLAAQVAVSGKVQICDNVQLSPQTRVSASITMPGSYTSGTSLDSTTRWHRNAGRLNELDALQQRVRALEKALRGLGARSQT